MRTTEKPELLGVEEWDHLEVKTISLNTESDGRRGIVISFSVELPESSLVFNGNTPLLKQPTKEEEEGEPAFYGEGWAEAIAAAEKQAAAFCQGKRFHPDLWEDQPVRPTEDGVESVKAAANGGGKKGKRETATAGK